MAVALLTSSTPARASQGARDISRIEVCVTETPGETIVSVAGDGCIGHADGLAACLLGLSARRPSLVRLDLSGLSCISCLALGVLVTFHRGVARAGGRMVLAEPLQEPVHAALERAGLFTLFGRCRESEITT